MKKVFLVLIIGILFLTGSSFVFSDEFSTLDNDSYSTLRNVDYLLASNLFTHQDILDKVNQKAYDMEDDGFIKMLFDENYELWINKSNGAFRYVNLITNYCWSSDILKIEDYEFNAAQANQSACAFEFGYRTEKNIYRNAYAYQCDLSFTVEGNKINVLVDNKSSQIKFSYSMEIKEGQVKINFNSNTIEEYGSNLITAITFYKYFGAVHRNEIPGYNFIPNGSGALIRYEYDQAIRSSYRQSFYGNDYLYTQNNTQDVLNLPIFGMVHGVNQNACLVEVLDGDINAKLNYTPSSTGQGFHMLFLDYTLRNTYSLPIPGSDPILMVPTEYEKINIEFSYNFLNNEEANYLGMANYYQKELIERNVLKKNETDSLMHLEILGSDYEQGLFFKNNIKMTKTEDIALINKELIENDIKDITYTLRGFSKGGNAGAYKKFSYLSSLGSLKEINDLDYNFYYNPSTFYSTSNKGSRDTLVNIYNNRSVITVSLDEKYLNLVSINKMINNTLGSIKKEEKLAFDGITNYLYGDKNSKYSRDESYKEIKNTLTDVTPMYKPNYYLLENTSRYYNINLYHDRLKFFTDTVPFLEILLRGYIPYYSSELNFSSNFNLDVLKCIEYGVYPTFMLTKEESYLLANTLSNDYYATTYYRVKDQLIEAYHKILNALNYVVDERIINRTVIEEGIISVEYQNGVVIYLNYTSELYEDGSIIINPNDYKVVV